MKFEYTVRQSEVDYKTLIHMEDKFLADMGNDGWELCCVLDSVGKRQNYYFKRNVIELSKIDELKQYCKGAEYVPVEEILKIIK